MYDLNRNKNETGLARKFTLLRIHLQKKTSKNKLSSMLKYILAIFVLFGFVDCTAEEAPSVLVSIAPHKFFVEKIAGDTVTVQLMVPAGASAHTYEPTPKQMLAASRADIWFYLGEAFEAKAMASLKAHNPKMTFYDMRNGVDMINVDPSSGQCCCCHAHSQDPHIWLSARQAKIQAETITKALSSHFPEHAHTYEQALKDFLTELDALDQEITAILQPLKNRTLLVSHPAYGYFCRDYKLVQLSIEFEGKDPTPQQMTKILNLARAAHIRRVFIQPQYSNKGAKLFASELGAKVVSLDPYSEHFMTSMLEIANQFSQN